MINPSLNKHEMPTNNNITTKTTSIIKTIRDLCMGGASHIRSIDLDDLVSRLEPAIACHQALGEHLQKVEIENWDTNIELGHKLRIGTHIC